MDEAAVTATTVPLFCQTYLGITITSTFASRFCDINMYFEICCMF